MKVTLKELIGIMWLPIVYLAFLKMDSVMYRICNSQGETAMYLLGLLLGGLTVLIYVAGNYLLAKLVIRPFFSPLILKCSAIYPTGACGW